jgi:hypothetical protein
VSLSASATPSRTPSSPGPEEPTYTRIWCTGYSWFYKADFEAVEKPADLAKIIGEMAADLTERQTLCATLGITLDDVTFDKRNGYDFWFTTTDAEVAERFGFAEDEDQ